MLVRRLSAGALCFLASITLVSGRVSSETGDKQLARVKGVVGYQASATGDFKPIFGRLDLPDDAFAVTKPNASAVLRLKDSSEIDIGENTKVQVGAFTPAESGNANTINLQGGALHFNIRHPQGGQSNYKFVTATSQIAVRGTEGFLVAGANGTQVVCVSCAAGDVTVQVGQQTVSIVSNQTLTVLGTNPLSATTTISTNPTVNNPAVNQFNNNSNPFTTTTSPTSVDPTGSLSGGGTGAAAGAGAGAATAVGAAAGTAAVVATVAKPGDSASPQPSSAPVVGTLVVQVNYAGANVFPATFSWPFSQINATGLATFTCAPASIVTCTPQQSISNGTLNGVLSGTFLSAGAFTVSGSASGYVLPTTTFNVYGAVAASPTSLTFGESQPLPATQNVTVTQAGATQMNATVTCPGGTNAANVTISPASGPSPLTLAVTANSAPPGPNGQACTITVVGQGDGHYASTTIQVNVTGSNVTITGRRRKT